MKEKIGKVEADPSTEEKIKNAARNIFHKKGYAGTRTRDIAEEAGINLALLNYYFRSKEKLFGLIMMETMQGFLKSMTDVFNERETTLEMKVEQLVSNYIDLLTEHPNIPIFILSELRNNPEEVVSKMKMKEFLMGSYFFQQMQEAVQEKRIAQVHPLHFVMNILGMTVFPFIAKPMLTVVGDMQEENFNTLMQQRKKLIPQWIKSMLATG